MRHTLLYCRDTLKDHVIAAYFFNARGNTLEKTPLGMLRSLLYQLLDQDRVMCERFIPKFLNKQKKGGKEWEWHLGELKDFLFTEMKRSQHKPLLLLIDALDECNESEVRAVVSFLESLSVNAVGSNTVLNICLSSRYYPHVSIEIGLELTVEREGGHDQDIAKYVQHKLRVRNKEIEQELLQKAEHIFMWVVLVVEILNKAFDDGEVRAMQKKLLEIPRDLDEVFFALLNKDNPKKQETTLMLQWVLFARRLLKPEELYFAVLAGIGTEGLGAWNRSNDTPEMIKRFITSTSKGLVEIRKGYEETVQFIHESVNDFLLRNKRLQTLDPMLEQHPVGTSHDRLAACCMSYIMIEELEPSVMTMSDTKSKDFREPFNYPFLEYAVTSVLHHPDKAIAGDVTQQARVQKLQHPHNEFGRLRTFHDTFRKGTDWGYIRGADLVYVLSLYTCYELLQAVLKNGVKVNVQGGEYGNALQAASWRGSEAVVALLIKKGADVNAQGGEYGNALQAASWRGSKAIVALLLENGADVNAQGGVYGNALQAASWRGSKAIVALLLEKGANVNAQGGEYGNALQAASCFGSEAVVALLIKKGADVNAQGGEYGNALQAASIGGEIPVVALLLEKGADVNAQGGVYGNALQAASCFGRVAIVALLLENGADVNTQGGEYGNALQAASYNGHEEIVQQLREAGTVPLSQTDSAGQNRPIATRTRLKRNRALSGMDS
jgi:ankyrin repeat domain-containing protein 50